MIERVTVFALERLGDVLVVEPLGDEGTFRYFDIHNQSNRVMRMLDDASLRGVVIDFHHLPSLGWVMTSSIVRLVRNIDYRGGVASFCNASPENRTLFESLHLGDPWSCHASREEAVEALNEMEVRRPGEAGEASPPGGDSGEDSGKGREE